MAKRMQKRSKAKTTKVVEEESEFAHAGTTFTREQIQAAKDLESKYNVLFADAQYLVKFLMSSAPLKEITPDLWEIMSRVTSGRY